MNKIPTHKISEKFHGETAFMRYVSENEQIPAVDYAHRDDYYIFLFVEKGGGKLLLDFEEYEITEGTVLYILPGQVHSPVGCINACGWILAVDSMLVEDEYREIFEKTSFARHGVGLDEDVIGDLKCCASVIYRRLGADRQYIGQNVVHSLISSCIGIIAETYRKRLSVTADRRSAVIASEFRSLLSSNYRSLKRPSQYASMLNLSPAYLNEAVKKNTGSTVSECIQNEIITQAKRLLFYTEMSIKEVGLDLGYEDWAYFTRLFTKCSGISPVQFRRKYRK